MEEITHPTPSESFGIPMVSRRRRFFAFAIDAFLLGMVGAVLGGFFFTALASMGEAARGIGFAIWLVYFGTLNSAWGGGQTVGQRLLKITVVDREGMLLSPIRSFLRAAILGLPYCFNEIFSGPGWVAWVTGAVLFGLLGAIIYLWLFNRRTGQSLHDLAVGAYVIPLPLGRRLSVPSLWKGHAVVLAILALAAVAGAVFASSLVKTGWLASLVEVQKQVMALDGVRSASIAENRTVHYNGKGTAPTKTKVLAVTVAWNRHPNNEAVAREVAAIVLPHYPNDASLDSLDVVVAYGYTLGIFSGWEKNLIRHSLSEWRRLVQGREGSVPAAGPEVAPVSAADSAN